MNSLAQLRGRAFEVTPTGLLITDRNGIIVDVNRQIEEIFGHPACDLLGQRVEILLPASLRENHRDLHAGFLRNPVSKQMGQGRIIPALHARGHEIFVEIGLHRLLHGEEPFVVASVADVTNQRKLTRARAFEAAIITSTDDAVVGISIGGRIATWNGGAARLFGYSADEILGQPVGRLAPENLAGEVAGAIAKAVAGQKVPAYETLRRNRDGELIDVSVVLSPVFEGGQRIGTSAIYRDIRARRRIEHSLAESRARYQAIVEASTEMISLATADGELSFVNSAYAQRFGLSPEAMVGRKFLDFVFAEDRAAVAERFREVMSLGRELTTENRSIAEGGEERWIEWTNRGLTDDSGRRVVFHSIGRDITERKRFERALALSEMRYRELFESSPVMLHSIDDKGRLLSVNKAWLQTLGYTASEVIGRSSVEFLAPSSREYAINTVLPAFFRDGRCDEVEYQMVCKDGSIIDVLLSATMDQDERGRPVRSIAVITDVTARRRAQQEKMDREAAERASRAKSAFLARMSHELRTPLNAILGFAQILRHGRADTLTDRQRNQAEQIELAGWHLLNLVNEVLDITQIESGRIVFDFADIDPVPVVDEVLALEQPHATGLAVQLDVARAGAEAVRIRADRNRLKQVLLNVVSNGIKYNRPGGRVTIDFADFGQRAYAIRVRDTGIGMDDAQRANLFEPFQRLGMERTKIEGVGIGLMVSRLLVEHMGGELIVESAPGTGSTFTLVFPASPVNPA